VESMSKLTTVAKLLFYAYPLTVPVGVLMASSGNPLAVIPASVAWVAGLLVLHPWKPKRNQLSAPRTDRRKILAAIPENARRELEELQGIEEYYTANELPLAKSISAVVSYAEELFQRMALKNDSQNIRISTVRYRDILSKLNQALGLNYYVDISRNPELWSNPQERMEAVEKALSATGEELLRNIRQINADQDLASQLSLDGLLALEEKNANSSIISK